MATASLVNTGMHSAKTKAAMRGANPENFNVIISGRKMRASERLIYIHSVAKRTFGPLTHLLFPRLILKGCQEGERWVTCAVVGDPIPQASPDQERGGTRIDEEDAWRACIDLLNPNNPTNDPYWNAVATAPAYMTTAQDCNLVALGVWPSLNEIPTEEEIRKAEGARDDSYRRITQRAIQLSAKSRRELNDYLSNHPEVHTAMDALGLTADWHQTAQVKAACPNCGDEIKAGIAFHKSSAGVLCVIDPYRAFKAGAIDRARFEALTEGEEPAGDGQEPETRFPARRGRGRPAGVTNTEAGG
jgi:hypothetical protein